ncbi:MAG: 30S ribosomal protein S3ae [Thermoplasmata archaeon]
MAKRKSRRAARRVKDKWKSKSWYRIVAPDMFEGALVGETPSTEPEDLLGRITEVTLQDLVGDFSKVHIKVQLKINGVRGGECVTRFIGHDMTTDYVRRLTRRRRSKIDSAYDVTTKEGYDVRLKVLSVTDKRINSSIKRSIRQRQSEIVNDVAGKSTLSQLTQKLLFGGLATKLKRECKEIYPLKRVEIRKSEVRSVPRDEKIDEKIVSEEEMEEIKEKEEAAVEEEAEIEEVETEKTKPEVMKEFQEIEGVGPTMAEKLYDGGFTSIESLKEASQEGLTEIEGVGKAFSEKIYTALHE